MAAGPRVALVHDWLTGMRGGEKVLEHIAGLFPEAPIYTLFHFPGSVSSELEGHPIRTSFLQDAPGIRRHYRHYLPLFPAAVEDFDLSSFDLILSSSHCVAKGVVPPPLAHHLCYCHTPMRYAWDQEHRYFPVRRGVGARVRGWLLTQLRSWDVASSVRVDTFLANSTFVARRIQRYYGREARVLAPPVDVDFFRPHSAADEPAAAEGERYCLMVASLAPYKRVDLAIEACRRLELELRVVGEGPQAAELAQVAGPQTRLLGRVGKEELRRLYRGALCLLQPGIEDFGIATVEALACATPVVALDRGGVQDIVDDGTHGVLFSQEDDAGALADAIDKCLRVGFNKLNLRGRAETFQASRFEARLKDCLGDWLS